MSCRRRPRQRAPAAASVRACSGWTRRRWLWARRWWCVWARPKTRGIVSAVDKAVDPGHLAPQAATTIGQNHVGEIEVSLAQALAGDPQAVNPFTGRIVLELDGRIAGGGLVLAIRSPEASQPQHGAARSGQAGESVAARVANLAPRFAALPPAGRLALLRDEIGRQDRLYDQLRHRGSGHPAHDQ